LKKVRGRIFPLEKCQVSQKKSQFGERKGSSIKTNQVKKRIIYPYEQYIWSIWRRQNSFHGKNFKWIKKSESKSKKY
jgi:hypothetical protein